MDSRPVRPVSKLAAFATSGALCIVLIVLAAWGIQAYYLTITRAEERVTASAKIVASHASWVHQLGIQAVRRIDDALSDSDLVFDGRIRDIGNAAQGLPENVRAYVVDAAGRTLYSTDPDIKAVNITDRDYFVAVRDGQMEYVSPLLISRLNGSQIFVFSRRIVRNGVFKGAITVSVPADIMRPIWETVDLGGNYTVSFIRSDGMLVARYPKPAKALDMSRYMLFTKYLKEAPASTYLATASPLDGVKRIVGYRRVEGTPFVAVAAADYNALIQPFWHMAFMLAVIGAVVLAGAIAAGWWIRHLLSAQEQQAVALENALETNEMLLREIHHRVKNNLQSVVSLVRMHMRDAVGFDALNSRIRAMISVHEQIYMRDEYAAVDAAQLTETVVKSALSAHAAPLNIHFDLAPQPISSDKATALALLVNEVVTNAIKYAYPATLGGPLWVSLSEPDGTGASVLVVRDEGAGFDTNSVKPGTGTRLIDGSVRQLDGAYALESNGGTCFSAHIKLR